MLGDRKTPRLPTAPLTWLAAAALVLSTIAAGAAGRIASAADTVALTLSGADVHLADAATGAALLGSVDGFVELQSPFDRQLRMSSLEPVTATEYLAFAAEQARDWSDDERARLADAIESLAEGLATQGLALSLPGRVDIVKTTGTEELGVCGYTRATYVVITEVCLRASGTQGSLQLTQLLAHELVHVMSRHDPALRDELYATIGFEPLEQPFEAPDEVADLRLTNPDAPLVEHVITLDVAGRMGRFVPTLFSPRAYDGGGLVEYLDPRLLRIEDDDSAARDGDGALETYAYADVPAFFERVGANTGYIIHPEEILADNIALLLLGRREGLPSPERIEAIAEVLAAP